MYAPAPDGKACVLTGIVESDGINSIKSTRIDHIDISPAWMQGWDYLVRAADLGGHLKVWSIQRDALLRKQHAIALQSFKAALPLSACFAAGNKQSHG